MHTLTMPLAAAKTMCQVLLPHVTKDLYTPTLNNIIIKSQYAYATDRFTVGRFDITNLADSDADSTLFLPRKAAQFIGSIGPSMLLDGLIDYRLRVEWVDKYVIVSLVYKSGAEAEVHASRTFHSFDAVTGKAPPVEALFEGLQAGEDVRFHVSTGGLEKFAAASRVMGAPLRITTTAYRDGQHTRVKKSPVLIEAGDRFKGLLQPVIANHRDFGNDIIHFATAQDGDINLPGDTGEQPKGN